MTSADDCYRAAIGAGVDPGGTPWAELDPALLARRRTSTKWTRFPGALPMFVAEMDFSVAPEIRRALIERIEASDTGYLDGPGPLAPAFADFARERWGWAIPHDHVHLSTDVATGVVESLRALRPEGGRIAVPTPVYPGFFEMLVEVPFEVVEVPLADRADAPPCLDLAALERLFAEEPGIDALLLCNPHNPHGIVHEREHLAGLARLAAASEVLVVSDEIHAPLTHRGADFVPFAPIAAAAGALAVVTTSASKGWNLAGVKCAMIVAADERANELLRALPPETATRTSILGLHASIAAFREGRDWLDRAVAQSEANLQLLEALVAERLTGVRVARSRAGYLAWLDLRDAGLGERPQKRILADAAVALNDGRSFGLGGEGHARINLACAPDTIVEAIDRIARLQA
ncbi:MAG: aminotransferase class I/II-fold pyridoxal phosphate-dependent enzyme [Candidatus Leucobacter sulfamidivorax]|nr:aminotransferase class I/II-fold pyridoxal phosphate-dependent enzyme [Candidatus Leucobacter sulfamidivorax]